jgi:hypothetical protein
MENQKIAAIILEAGRKIRDEATSVEHEQRIAESATEKILLQKEVLSNVIGFFEPADEEILEVAKVRFNFKFCQDAFVEGAKWMYQEIKEAQK